MTTEADRAQALELAEWERTQRQAIMARPAIPSAKVCTDRDCGDEIPQARREAIPGVLYCAQCQARCEQENNMRGRR